MAASQDSAEGKYLRKLQFHILNSLAPAEINREAKTCTYVEIHGSKGAGIRAAQGERALVES